MSAAILRKARHVLDDPVLRRWLLRRIAGIEKSPPKFVMGAPPYLGRPSASNAKQWSPRWTGRESTERSRPVNATVQIDLPGLKVDISSDNAGALFDRDYPDLETLLAAHRFAWVPLAGPSVDNGWVNTIWEAWISRYNTERTGWPWHAYTTAERAINIIDFSARFGLPGNREETIKILASHADEIRWNLEYFGEHYTSNHLSNNGRGLLKIGVSLGLREHANDGAEIMIAEAGRIFGRSGLLNEGSSHYHLLATRNYIDAWLAASSAQMESAPLLKNIAERAVAAIGGLELPGGIPLIGDISPDGPPTYFALLPASKNGDLTWLSNLDEECRRSVINLISGVSSTSPDSLAEDGWHRFEARGWHALAFVSPDGWPPMPGHGHQDLGSFELHDGDCPVIIDPGRGTYEDEAYQASNMHNYLTIGGKAAMPTNRPYYSDMFRCLILPKPPTFARTNIGAKLVHYGFSRFRGLGKAEREWRTDGDSLSIEDRLEGTGSHLTTRRFVVCGDVSVDGQIATLRTKGRIYTIKGTTKARKSVISRWAAYGRSVPATIIEYRRREKLPSNNVTVIKRVGNDR